MRHIRQEQLSIIPVGFQKKIKTKKIVIIGCGGVGSPLAELLVRGGFLNIVLIDFDKIDETNLNRQIYFEQDLGKIKSFALKEHLLKIDKNAKIQVFEEKISEKNISKVCTGSDLIVDATDNFKIRKIINDYAQTNEKSWLYNGAIKTEFITCLFYGKENMFSKVFPKEIKEEKAGDVGILASTTFAAASLAYNQVLKYFLEIKDDKLIKIDLWNNKIYEVKIR